MSTVFEGGLSTLFEGDRRASADQGNRSDARQRWLVDTHIKPALEAMKRLGLLRVIGADEENLPHALFAMLGAASLIFAVPQNVRRLTGADPRKPDVIEAHADFVADLLIRQGSSIPGGR